MAEYVNYLARKINGPVAQALLKASHALFNASEEWLLYRTNISIDNATTEDLERIGVLIGAPRPYAITENDEVVYASDEVYRKFIYAIAYLKRAQSIKALADMLAVFVPNGRFELEFRENGDIGVAIDAVYHEYLPFLQSAANAVYTALPRLQPFEERDYSWYIVRHVFMTNYVLLNQPSFWYFTFDATKHIGYIYSEELSSAEVAFGVQTLTKEKMRLLEDHAVTNEDFYVAYKDAENVIHLDGKGLGMRLPLNPGYSGTEHADSMANPASLETDEALGQYGLRLTLKPTDAPNKHIGVLFTEPNTDYPTWDVNYGNEAIDNVPRVESNFNSSTHTCMLNIYNTQRILNMTVTQSRRT